ncbi:MAG: outer membrane beta-barrel family protein [Flavihumibacter sp.]|nr:outer membrane beta-barrel family protein [Flavihumibacter sp.]
MKKHLLLIFLLSVSITTLAQKDGMVRGLVTDTSSKQALAEATVTILNAKDSTLVSFARTNKNGFFSIKGLDNGNYRLLITHIGYRNVNKFFLISDALKDIDFGTITINNTSNMLDEVVVTQERPPVTIRNDTIEFNAASFKTRPNAVVEDLIKRLPGAQVDKDGTIRVNGEKITRVLVDGKEFFGNDPKMATKNLPAEAVEKVQVFDRKSDQSRFTGFDDGNSEKAINLTIKPDKKNGIFGRATAGGGDKGRYQGNFNVNSFNKEKQISAIGMGNNTNKDGFSFMDIMNFSGGGASGGRGMVQIDNSSSALPIQGSGNNQGISTTWAGGLNFNNTFQKKLELNGSYFYNNIGNSKIENIKQQWLLPGNNFNTYRNNNTNTGNQNHRINFSSDYKIDTANSVKFTSAVNYQQSSLTTNNQYQSLSIKNTMLNSGYSKSSNSGNGYSWNNSVLFRHRFPKKGRTLSTTLSFNINNTNSNGSLLSENDLYNPQTGTLQSADTLDQINNQDNDSKTYGAVVSYTEPLSKKSLLEFNYNFNSTVSNTARTTYDFDDNTGKHSIKNNQLSNVFDNTYTYHRAGTNFRHQRSKYNFAVGASFQQAFLNSNYTVLATDSSIHRSFQNLLPNANFQYSFNRSKNLRFVYNTATRQPSVTQLQPVADNTDPLNITIGNPDLKQEYTHRMQLNYIAFDPFRRTSFFSMLSATTTNNKIVNADQLGAQGQRITRPVNADGAYTLFGNMSWGFPFRKLKSTINLNTSLTQSRSISFVNSNKNFITNRTATQGVTWTFTHKEVFDFTAGANVNFNSARYSLEGNRNQDYWNQNYTLEANLYLPKGFSMATDIDYTTRTGLSEGYNADVWLWNAGVAKQLFKNKKGELRLQVYDLLNQNKGIKRSTTQNYIQDSEYNVLRRFWQLSFTYSISRFAGKNIAAPRQRGNNIQIIGPPRGGM